MYYTITTFVFTYGKTSRKKLLESIILSTTVVVSHRLFRYNDYRYMDSKDIGIYYLCYYRVYYYDKSYVFTNVYQYTLVFIKLYTDKTF